LTKTLFFYRNKALKATGNHCDLLALCWRIVADAACNASKENQSNEIISLPGSFLAHGLNHEIPLTRIFHADREEEIANLDGSRIKSRSHLNKQPVSSQIWTEESIFNQEGMEEIAESYAALILQSVTRSVHLWKSEIEQTQQAAEKYRLLAPEVSFFAEEAANYFKKAQNISIARALLESYHLRITACAAVEVAIAYLHVEASRSRNNEILLYHWKEAAHYGEEAFYARIKAAEASHQKDEVTAIKWSLAAAAAAQVREAHTQLLELFPIGDQCLITHWNNLLHAAEETMQLRKNSTSLKKKNILSDHAAFWSEHYYDCYTKVIEAYMSSYPLANREWEIATKGAKHVASLWKHFKKLETKRSFTLARLYQQRRALYAEKKYRRMISDPSSKEVYFS